MSFSKSIQALLENYKEEKDIYDTLVKYFEKNEAARLYGEVCDEKGWEYIIDHLTIRTHSIDEAAKRFESMGWKHQGEKIEYKDQGWWAKVYRHQKYPPVFIDESYSDAPDNLQIVKKWVDKFGDKDFHHIAARLVSGVEIEEPINHLKNKKIQFPGKVTGPKGTRLRQIFTQAEEVDGTQYSVLELAERNIDKETGEYYQGFISEQADSLMKDSTL